MIFDKLKSLFSKPKLYGVNPEAAEADYPIPDIPESPPFIGKWAVLSYYVPGDLMHPEDQEDYFNGERKGESIFRCTEELAQWVRITNNENETYRVNPNRVIWVPQPKFELGENTQTTNGTIRDGWICMRVWHFKEKKYTYFIDVLNKNGKRVRHKRRYWPEDLKRNG